MFIAGRAGFAIPALCGFVLTAGLMAPVAGAADGPKAEPAGAVVAEPVGAVVAEPAGAVVAEPPAPRAAVVDLGGALCGRDVPLGRVRLPGPAGTTLIAAVSTSHGGRRLSIIGGSGRIGGMPLGARDFAGELLYRRGSFTGSVTIDLRQQPRLSTDWAQSTEVTAIAHGCAWTSTVRLLANGGKSGRVDLRGPLAGDGGFALTGTGVASFGGTRVPLRGELRTAGTPGKPNATWRVTGSAQTPASAMGARILAPRIEMTDRKPGVWGTGRLQLTSPSLAADATILVRGAGSWQASVDSSTLPAWTLPGESGIRVETSRLNGSIGARNGQPYSDLKAPGTGRIEGLDLAFTIGFPRPGEYTATAHSGRGAILGSDAALKFTGGRGALTLTPTTTTGSISVVTHDSLLLSLGDRWSSATTYVLTARPQDGWAFDRSLRHTMSNGDSSIRLHGPVDAGGGTHLTAAGEYWIEGTALPVTGSFERATALAPARWSLTAPIDRVPLKDGVTMVGGSVEFASPTTGQNVGPRSATSTQKCVSSITLFPGSSFHLPVTCNGTTQHDWTLTANGTNAANMFTPFAGLAIPETAFHGTLSSTTAGGQVWNARTDSVAWTDLAHDLDLSGTFTLTGACPLTAARCPGRTGTYFGGTQALNFDDAGLPDVQGTGAFLADSSWARWDATNSGSVTFEGISVGHPDLVVWKGDRSAESPELDMPDLSSYNGNGIGVEFCGTFQVPVPDVQTLSTSGCVEWSHSGIVVGQVATGGNVSADPHNGISMQSITLDGYAMSTLPDTVSIALNDQVLDLEQDVDNITAAIVVSGALMHDFGVPNAPATTVHAQGTFSGPTEFTLEADIPVNLKGGGATLKEITVQVDKKGSGFQLALDARADISIKGSHFPFDAYIGIKDGTEATVSLTAMGAQSTQTDGLMDFVNLVPGGDFEPADGSLIDGTFDKQPPASALTDGGFEQMTATGQLISDGGFESGVNANVMPDPDFEDGTSGNILPNADFEATDLLVNGDFEFNGGSLVGWAKESGLTATIIGGTADGVDDTGTYVARLSNSDNMLHGLVQDIHAPVAGTGLTLSASVQWIDGSSSTKAQLALIGIGCSYVQSGTITAIGTSWQRLTVSGTVASGCTGVQAKIYVGGGNNATIAVDAVQLAVTSVPSGLSLPTLWRPHLVATFDSLAKSPLTPGYSSGVAIATDYPGTLKADGKQSWTIDDTAIGYTSGDFDVSYRVLFPTNSSPSSDSRELANFGFWLNGSSPTAMSGYCFRLQTSSTSGDGGFYSCSNGNATAVSGMAKVADVSRGTWYSVRLTAIAGRVTALVTDESTGLPFFTQTLSITSSSGMFGGVAGCCSNAAGVRWDDISFYSLQGQSATSMKSPTQVWLDSTRAHSGQGSASLSSTQWSDVPLGYANTVEPAAKTAYTYGAWVRAAQGSITGTIALSAVGGTEESASRTFTATTTWSHIAVTLPVSNTGHTDLHPTIALTAKNAELRVDDQVLQQVPWTVSSGMSAEVVTSDDSVSATHVLRLTTGTASGSATIDLGKPAGNGTKYTLGYWLKAPQGTTGSITLSSTAGNSHKAFTATGSWQHLTISHTGEGGSTHLVAGVTIDAGTAGRTILIDDASLSVDEIDSLATGFVGAPSAEPHWIAETSLCSLTCMTDPNAQVDVLASSSKAHAGGMAMLIKAASGYKYKRTYYTSVTPRNGSVWRASAYVNASASASGVKLSIKCLPATGGMTSLADVSFTAGGGYAKKGVTATAQDCTGPLALEVYYSGSKDLSIYVDDIGLREVGSDPADTWNLWVPSGTLGVEGVSDDTAAHSGTGYLKLTGHSTEGLAAYVQTPYTPRSGDVRSMSAWVRSDSSTSVTGSIAIITVLANGNHVEQQSSTFSVSNSWQLVYVDLPVTNMSAVALRTEIDIPGNATLWVDDIDARGIKDWKPSDAGVAAMTVLHDYPNPVDGSNVVITRTGNSQKGIQVTSSSTSLVAGSTMRLRAYVRSTSSSTTTGTLTLTPSTGTAVSQPINAGPDWAPVDVEWTAASTGTVSFTVTITPASSRELLVDAVTLQPDLIVQSSPWLKTANTASFAVREDTAVSHGGSYGSLQLDTTAASQGVYRDMAVSPAIGDVLTANVWVLSRQSSSVTGTLTVEALDGPAETWAPQPFTASQGWSLAVLRIPITKSGHTQFRIKVLLDSAGKIAMDDASVQDNPWLMTTSGGSGTQTTVNDSVSSQSGSSYTQIVMSGATRGMLYEDMAASADMSGGKYAAGSTYAFTVYVRSHDGTSAHVAIALGTSDDSAMVSTEVAGTAWRPITVPYTLQHDAATLRPMVILTTNGVKVDVDSGTLSNTASPALSVDDTLPHPQSGYTYLWDDAFGIPGSHLWMVSAQVEYKGGTPGFGIGATVYQDPTAAPTIMKGTDWIRGDMVVNFSKSDPCFRFDFASTGNSRLSVAHGVLDAPNFSISFAPRGCQVGAYAVPRGAALSFDDYLGDGLLHLSLAITPGPQGPQFDEDLGIANVVINGTTFQDVKLGIHLSPGTADDSVSFSGDMILPMGNFHGDLHLVAEGAAVQLQGDVAVSDWEWSGGGFDVDSFSLGLDLNVPGPGQCSAFAMSGSGSMSMAEKTHLAFSGNVGMDCGTLKTLHIQYVYTHGGVSQDFMLDYDSATRILAGGVGFDFERKISWSYLSHKYERHPDFSIGITFSMDVTDPGSTAEAEIDGKVSVSGGDGEVDCELSASGEDSCHLHVHVSAGGGHTYNSSW